MNLYIKSQYKNYLVNYLKQEYKLELKNLKNPFTCPICHEEECATIFPNNETSFYCVNPTCSFQGDIFDLIRKTKNPKMKDEQIAEFLQHKFKLEIKDDINELLKLYAKNKFRLFPLIQGSSIPVENKKPVPGFMWEEKEYTNPKIWKEWVERGYGLAVRLGKFSNLIAIDIDSDTTYEKMKELLGEDTLIQITKKGRHWVFLYEDDFDFLNHANLRNKGYDMEVRCNHAYIAVAPTSTEGELRKWNNKKIQKMPPKLKEFLLGLIDKNDKSPDEEIQEAINKNDLGEGLKGLDGCCNDWFVKFGGILRKKCNIEQVDWTLTNLNNSLENPMPNKDIRGIIRQLNKYQTYDKQELADEVLKRLEVIKEATGFQIAGSLKREQKDIEDVLAHLENENKILSLAGRKFRLLEEVEWTHDKENKGVPIDFVMPYFHDYARFNKGGMIIIGSPTGRGKTSITGNIIKQLWEQKIVTHLIDTEPDGGIQRITNQLRLPEEAYVVPKKLVKHPTDIELKNNVVTIVDWLRMKDGDFTKTDPTFEHFSNQLKKHSGFLIVFVQIRTKNNEWFAPDQIRNYASLSAKYLWGNGGVDGENTCFVTDKIRDSKTGQQYVTIPTLFHQDTKILEVRK